MVACYSTPFADISDFEKPTVRKKVTCGKFTKSLFLQLTCGSEKSDLRNKLIWHKNRLW